MVRPVPVESQYVANIEKYVDRPERVCIRRSAAYDHRRNKCLAANRSQIFLGVDRETDHHGDQREG